jgi:hypothetical protein
MAPYRLELARQADALLRDARIDAFTGMKRDKQFRRNKRAKNKVFAPHWRAKEARLGKFGRASPVRSVASE